MVKNFPRGHRFRTLSFNGRLPHHDSSSSDTKSREDENEEYKDSGESDETSDRRLDFDSSVVSSSAESRETGEQETPDIEDSSESIAASPGSSPHANDHHRSASESASLSGSIDSEGEYSSERKGRSVSSGAGAADYPRDRLKGSRGQGRKKA